MTDDDDIDGLAAEYVLGPLDLAERQRVAARCRTDAAAGQGNQGLGEASRAAQRRAERTREHILCDASLWNGAANGRVDTQRWILP
jgi:hypothetical protein